MTGVLSPKDMRIEHSQLGVAIASSNRLYHSKIDFDQRMSLSK